MLAAGINKFELLTPSFISSLSSRESQSLESEIEISVSNILPTQTFLGDFVHLFGILRVFAETIAGERMVVVAANESTSTTEPGNSSAADWVGGTDGEMLFAAKS